jgi:hypothetical protein
VYGACWDQSCEFDEIAARIKGRIDNPEAFSLHVAQAQITEAGDWVTGSENSV